MFPISGVGIEDGAFFDYCRAVECKRSRIWDHVLVIEALRFICRTS